MNRMPTYARWTRLLAVGAALALLAGCGDSTAPGFPGYVEGEYVRVAAPLAGSLARLSVQRGDQIALGAPLFALESEEERAARAQAEARVRQSEATLADLEKAKRPPEIAAAQAQLAQAQATLKQAEADLVRTRMLVADKFLSPQKLDEAVATRDAATARVAELRAQVSVANMPARVDAIEAARADVKAAGNALAQAQWRLDQKTQNAPVAALVADTLYRQGEWVAAGAPVVSLLPPENVKLRFFVPETTLSSIRRGQRVSARCDGCASPIVARVTFIAPQAEYTPPVIYSRENRSKLVYLIEARPEPPNPALHPGLPVEVTLAGS
jgi:HlyD family secretion protein